MQITVSGKGLDVTDSLRAFVGDELKKIGSRYDNVVTANVTLSTDKTRRIVEITLFGKGFEMRAEEREMDDMYPAISSAVKKLEKQMARAREKNITSRRGREAVAPEYVEAPVAEEAPGSIKIESTFKFNARPMAVEEAVKAMEEKGYTFYAFNNMENGRVNVVYVAERGYGLIDPVL